MSSHNTAPIRGFMSHLTGDVSCEIEFDLKYKGMSQDFVIKDFLEGGLFKVCLVVTNVGTARSEVFVNLNVTLNPKVLYSYR